MIAGIQRLIDAHDHEYKPDDETTIAASWGGDLMIWLGELNPGQTASGALVFDVPTGATRVAVRLHDGLISRGAVVHSRWRRDTPDRIDRAAASPAPAWRCAH